MTEENWLPIPGWEGVYEVSDLGRIRSLDRVVTFRDGRRYFYRGRILRHQTHPSGHSLVRLSIGRHRETARIHAAVMLAFVGPRPPDMEVCHGNGDPADNRLINLRYDTRGANLLDSVRHGTHGMARKTRCKRGHPFDEANTYIRTGGKRGCRACNRAKALRYVRAKRALREAS